MTSVSLPRSGVTKVPAIARVIAHALPNTLFSIKPFESESHREFVLFCFPGLLALLLLISQGLDIGMGVF
jgi:hypothetical protein